MVGKEARISEGMQECAFLSFSFSFSFCIPLMYKLDSLDRQGCT